MHRSITWILVADGSRARVLANEGRKLGVREVAGTKLELVNPPSHEQSSDRPGRTHESAGPARHAQEPRTDPHREAKVGFAREIAEMLRQGREAKRFDRLVLIAPPFMLGVLRDVIDRETGRRVIGEIAKDLTQVSDAQLHSHLAGIFPA
ncbi:MAG: host attachment protein [Alphaproteobacteria bacterium]|nr:host attachment protein [Alphaproteobacteria bacterium]